ncbi:C-type mannose receptor 2-like [Sardina pilchardus]|uniref:C-type mannose receptor 2-like n=1 Tax=Sardina pilchardus TaxID=27697 RepID=UPI002E1418D6
MDMDSPALLLLLMSAVTWSVMARSPHQYHFVSEEKSWTDAQALCREQFTDLATVESEQDVGRLLQLAGDHGHSGEVWIGLYQDVQSWTWSLNQAAFYGEGEMGYSNWGHDQPDNYRDADDPECCIEMKDEGKGYMWNDIPCKFNRHFICYDGNSDSLILSNGTLSWEDAQRYCRTHHTDLASVRNESEQQQVSAILRASTWIGLYRDCLLFRWSDQSGSPFRNWSSSSPSPWGNCAAVDVTRGGDWYDRSCDLLKPFVCYDVPKVTHMQTMRVELKTDSQKDMSDPAVQAAILQQIEKRLREKGLPAGAKLKWREQEDGQIFSKKTEKKGMKKRSKRRSDEL